MGALDDEPDPFMVSVPRCHTRHHRREPWAEMKMLILGQSFALRPTDPAVGAPARVHFNEIRAVEGVGDPTGDPQEVEMKFYDGDSMYLELPRSLLRHLVARL
jgi:hypothetical protein